MSNHKVSSAQDIKSFVETDSFHELYLLLKSLKKTKGKFILVLGTPGTGKSANIYAALSQLELKVFEAHLFIDLDTKPAEVYKIFWDTLKEDMGVQTKKGVYNQAEEYDLILFSDPFLDSEYYDPNKVGLGLWTEENGPKTAPFYFRVLFEYLKHRRDLKNINVLIQNAWVFQYKGVKYDILTDFSFISRLLVFILKQFCEVVLISYTKEEIIDIVKSHSPEVSDMEIHQLIKDYGKRPRFIFEALDRK